MTNVDSTSANAAGPGDSQAAASKPSVTPNMTPSQPSPTMISQPNQVQGAQILSGQLPNVVYVTTNQQFPISSGTGNQKSTDPQQPAAVGAAPPTGIIVVHPSGQQSNFHRLLSDLGTTKMFMALFVTFGFCNFCCGIPAILFAITSAQAAREGDMEESRKKGKLSMYCSIAGIVMACSLAITFIVYFIIEIESGRYKFGVQCIGPFCKPSNQTI